MVRVVWAVVMVFGLGYLAFKAIIAYAESKRWPPPLEMPYWCARCRYGFRTDALFTMHLHAQHEQRFGPLKAHLDSLKPKRKRFVLAPHLKLLR